jgi:hypothetical protein
MLEHLPRRVLGAFGAFAAEGNREVLDGGVKRCVCVAAFEEFEQMLAQGTRIFLLGTACGTTACSS